MTDDLLTKAERKTVAKLGCIMRDFQTIVGDDPGSRSIDLDEAQHHIHALQNMVLAQAAARAYPTKFRLMGSRVGQ